MAGKIKAIIKRPDEKYGHMTTISPTLENLQKHVEGPIQAVPFGGFTILCNEEGKLRGLPKNCHIGCFPYWTMFVGTIIVVGTDGEDFTDAPIDFKTWKSLLKTWGN